MRSAYLMIERRERRETVRSFILVAVCFAEDEKG